MNIITAKQAGILVKEQYNLVEKELAYVSDTIKWYASKGKVSVRIKENLLSNKTEHVNIIITILRNNGFEVILMEDASIRIVWEHEVL